MPRFDDAGEWLAAMGRAGVYSEAEVKGRADAMFEKMSGLALGSVAVPEEAAVRQRQQEGAWGAPAPAPAAEQRRPAAAPAVQGGLRAGQVAARARRGAGRGGGKSQARFEALVSLEQKALLQGGEWKL